MTKKERDAKYNHSENGRARRRRYVLSGAQGVAQARRYPLETEKRRAAKRAATKDWYHRIGWAARKYGVSAAEIHRVIAQGFEFERPIDITKRGVSS